ncbi:hypothetical protein LWM68_31095 [Niabella sp. W65]|nr:hypothetical protein [Niabella sp. W65]MCH7366821.1 hypothetical protein [Niabella sp. W65]ULT42522.1 hypothetical protein KRR40_02630 [Niabella sp. I65]
MAQVLSILSLKEATDDQLLGRFKQTGDQQALAELYLRYSELLYGVCLKYLEDAEEAKDAVMNIYQELLKKCPCTKFRTLKAGYMCLPKIIA